ncbi:MULTISPECIES: AcvB/VirJ family lysyl-phosphatidylglycerol hydrolase [unclassified Novosphingobium]|uniref:AcvB/VirJ family lysyl-phosphatidylglycerol hydrolase n=1 Tax=unclassified Novosphingobium TaxID=2644732 RepID=UPI00135B70AF|nr:MULTISPECIES: AcvB/VirJ family lysyl-phosphatidylglycerol hydrolase [unclassified Novosphingobium]
MRKRGKVALAAVAALAIAFAGWLGHIGYFGGQLYFEVPARTVSADTPRTVAVLFSGDMGFRVGMGPQIAKRLAADGIPVLGVSSLVHFRQERSPQEVRTFVADAARRALAFAHADRLILIGQSFGADMLQVGAVGLPADLRSKVQMVALVVPGDSVIFRASPAELFNWVKPDAQAMSTASQLTWTPVLCVHGMEEADSLCPLLHMPNVRNVALPGGHPMHHNPAPVYAALKSEIAATQGVAGNWDGRAKVTESSDSRHSPAIPGVSQGSPEPETQRTGP